MTLPGTPNAPEPPTHNLPLALTSFVGREKEVAQVKGLLLANRRLLTLTGPGGCGKTRLALESAFEAVEGFEDGVWWVGLAPLLDPDLVPRAVAQVLDVRERPDVSFTDTLVNSLGEKRMLLVLDNCEHLIAACAEFARAVLLSCPRLQILATSREVLGVAGETNWPVPSLASPEEAVALFVERARSKVSTFALTSKNTGAVAQVCRKLDGIPLAIELAAARVPVLSAEQISDRLEDPLKLLTAGGRTADPRHRTLRATLSWSHELLSEPERVLFGRLSVFAGGWTLEAAEAVGVGIEEDEVLDLLSGLVDKSMVVAEAGPGGALRYRMLEPVRQYARERLEEAGEGAEVRRRHAYFFLGLTEEAGPGLLGPQQVAWLQHLETEHDNLRAALGWALESGEVELGLRLAGALGGFWNVRGHLGEGRRWLEAALARGTGAPEPARTTALMRAGWMAREQGDYERSAVLTQESLALARKLGDKVSVAAALYNLSWAALLWDELEQARELSQGALALQREMNNEVGVAHALTVLGFVANGQRDYDKALSVHEESLELARETQDGVAIALALMSGALASLGRGDGRRARRLCEEGLELSWRLKMVHPTASHLQIAASVAGSQGQSARSARLWGAAESLLEAIDSMLASIERRFHEPYIAAARAGLGEAAFTAAWSEGQTMTPEQAIEYALSKEEEQAEPPATTTSSAPTSYPAGLSAREAEVLKLVAQGLTNPQIAQRLFISPRTVNRHLNSIFGKIEVNSRAAATRFAAEHRLN